MNIEGVKILKFGDLIKKQRKKTGMTQGALAKKVGVSKNAILDWEKERYSPTDANNIAALESALGFKSGYLYSILYGNPTPLRKKEISAASIE